MTGETGAVSEAGSAAVAEEGGDCGGEATEGCASDVADEVWGLLLPGDCS